MLVSIHILPQSNSLAVSPSQHGCFNTKLWSSSHDLDVGHGSPKKTPMTSVSPSDVFFPWDFRYLNLPSPKIMRKIQRLEVFHHRQKSESPRLARSWCKTARSITFQTCPFVRWAPPARRPPPQCRKCPRMLVPRNRDDGGCREVVFTPRNGGEAG